METDNIFPILIGIVILIIVFLCIKRIAGCFIKTVIMLVIAGILAFVYFNYFKKDTTDKGKPSVIRKTESH